MKETWNIGDDFTSAEGTKRWRVTDVGTRVIVAVELDEQVQKDPSWLNGPPYAVAEAVFDEYDQQGIHKVSMRDIEELIDNSSLGTPEAKEIRAQAPPEAVAAVLRRVDELDALKQSQDLEEESLPQRTWQIITNLKGALRNVLEENEELAGRLNYNPKEAFSLSSEEVASSLSHLRKMSAANWERDRWTQPEKHQFLLDTCVRWLRREVSNEYLALVIQKWRGRNEAVRTSEVSDGPPPTAG